MFDQSLLQSFINNTRVNASFASHNRDNMTVETRCMKQSSRRTQRLFLHRRRFAVDHFPAAPSLRFFLSYFFFFFDWCQSHGSEFNYKHGLLPVDLSD